MSEPNDRLRLALLQVEQVQKDPETNYHTIQSLLKSLPNGTDIALLPEMWATGFMTSKEELDETLIQESWLCGNDLMKKWAKSHHTALFGSLIEPLEGGKLANTALFYTPEGTLLATYRKHQLFAPGGEKKYFVAGQERVQVAYKGFQIRLAICYDLRFPIWLRQSQELELYDLMLLCANWPSTRLGHWVTLLKSRAIENQAYIAAVNRIGSGPNGLQYPGHSVVLDSRGEELQNEHPDTPHLLTADLSLSALHTAREKFPALDTLDPYTITLP